MVLVVGAVKVHYMRLIRLIGSVAGVGLTLTLSACGSDSVELGEGIDSGTKGILIPESAVAMESPEGAWIVPDVKTDDLVDWYETKLPIGERTEGLAYCETQVIGETTSWLWWDDTGPDAEDLTTWLSVRVFEQKSEAVVMVGYNEDDVGGPC